MKNQVQNTGGNTRPDSKVILENRNRLEIDLSRLLSNTRKSK